MDVINQQLLELNDIIIPTNMPGIILEHLINLSEILELNTNSRQVKFVILRLLRSSLRIELVDQLEDHEPLANLERFEVNYYNFGYNGKHFYLHFYENYAVMMDQVTGICRGILYNQHPLELNVVGNAVEETANSLAAVSILVHELIEKFAIDLLF